MFVWNQSFGFPGTNTSTRFSRKKYSDAHIDVR